MTITCVFHTTRFSYTGRKNRILLIRAAAARNRASCVPDAQGCSSTVPSPPAARKAPAPTTGDLFEIMEAREGRCATIIASQLEPNEWHLRIEGELMAGSVLNRIATSRVTWTWTDPT